MTASPKFKLPRWPAAILPLLFFCLGLAFLPLVGIQDDEVLFATAVFHVPTSTVFDTHVFHREIPLMLLSYLGALKSWIYFPILMRIRPSYLTVRLPVLLIGTVTIWLFIWFLERTHGRRVAWVGGVLLATDTIYLLTTCFDWGPVALQHLLALGGLALLLKFSATGKRSTLFWGFFLFGVALWDKALFLWFFGGLVVATAMVFPRELWSRCTPKNLGLAAAGLFLGALPFGAYNVATNFDTFRSNSSFMLSQFPTRLHALRITWNGEILFDYMAHPPWIPGPVRDPEGSLEHASRAIHLASSLRSQNKMEVAFWAGILLLPLLWRTPVQRTLLFCLIAFAVGWVQMAITKDAGLSAHHITLLWPLPQWFLAVAFVEAAAWRPLQWKSIGTVLLTVGVLFLAGENLLLTNEYFYQFASAGPIKSWTDAIYRLSDEAGHIQADHLVLDDWGIMNPLIVLHRNRLPLRFADASFLDPATDAPTRKWQESWFDYVWIGHTDPFQQVAGTNQRMVRVAREAGFEKQMIDIVPDRNGRPVFEIFRFVRPGGTPPTEPRALANGR
jgi:hypothetical protein